MTRLVLSLVDYIRPASSDYSGRKQLSATLNRCIQSGCTKSNADGSMLCQRHWEQHNERQLRSKVNVRARKRLLGVVQLRLWR